jgi:hypothetical protein
MTTTTNSKPKKSAEELLALARDRAEKANARLLDTARKIEARASKHHARALFLMGEWLSDRIQKDAVLRERVRQTLYAAQPGDAECLHVYWNRFDKELEMLTMAAPVTAPMQAPSKASAASSSKPAASGNGRPPSDGVSVESQPAAAVAAAR